MKPTVLVVGGYGSVGAALCRDLAHSGDLTVIVAGRRVEAARRVASAWDGEARHLDLNVPATWEPAVAGISVVVVCMDQPSAAFPAFLFAHGIAYVDVTATDSFFREVEQLPPPDRSWALLSVGLAPGLTNVMARHTSGRMERIDVVEISILSGLGDSHGQAGLAWIANRLFDPKAVRDAALIDFGQRWGVRRAHAVDFSDQYHLRRALPAGWVRTRLCFDSRLATAAVFGIANRFAGSKRMRSALLGAAGKIRLGGRACIVAVDAVGLARTRPARERMWFYAEQEALTTARLAALMLQTAVNAPLAPGVHHAEAVVESEAFFKEVERRGIGRFVFGAPASSASRPPSTRAPR